MGAWPGLSGLRFPTGHDGKKLTLRGASSFLYATLIITHWFILLTCWATAIKYWVLHGGHQNEKDKVWTLRNSQSSGRRRQVSNHLLPHDTHATRKLSMPQIQHNGGSALLSLSPGFTKETTFGLSLFIFLSFKKKIIYLAAPVLAVVCGIQFPNQGLSLGPLPWECRVSATGP